MGNMHSDSWWASKLMFPHKRLNRSFRKSNTVVHSDITFCFHLACGSHDTRNCIPMHGMYTIPGACVLMN